MVTFRPIALMVGLCLLALAAFMVIPAVVMIFMGEAHWDAFLVSAAITGAVGGVLTVTGRISGLRISPREGFLLTASIWIVASVFASLPLVLVAHTDFADAFFETVSGITTTGSTVLSGLEYRGHGVLLWRSILQWLGGIGFIAMGVAILPFLRVGGMRLFRSESSDWSEKVTPRFGSFARAIALIYLFFTVLCAFCYVLAGMGTFDAVNHAMTTVATGGYSTYDASIGHFQSAGVYWVAIVFMIAGSLPFGLYVTAMQGKPGALWADEQVRGFVKFIALVSLGLALWLWLNEKGPVFEVITLALLHVISIVTTTGYAAEDYSQWGTVAPVVFFYLTFVGGCSGSTTGGMKIFRFQVAYLILRNQLYRLLHPHVVIAERYNNRQVSEDIIRSLVGFSFFYFLTIALLALVLAFLGVDLITSVTGAATAVSNVGPGLGPIIGPAGNFGALPDAAKWALSFGMLFGRLEIMTILVLLTPHYWRQ